MHFNLNYMFQYFQQMSDRQIQRNWKHPNLPPKPFLFEKKVSILDEDNPDSELNKSHLRGCFNLAVIFSIMFFTTQPIINFIDHGYFLNPELYNEFKQDFLFCLLNWPLFFLWSFTSYFLQVLIMKGLNNKVAIFIQHLTQLGLFIYSTIIILKHDWCSTHTAFVILQASVHFMKMHSYITVNRDYKLDHEEAKKQGRQASSNYPNNVTLKDFIQYMLTPWLVYAQYARKDSINFVYVLKKMIISAITVLIMYLVHSEYILPWIQKGEQINLIQLLLRLMLPCTAVIVLGFYLVFQNMCNFFAELSKLDHRQFYQDWWNSYTFQEFNRKWNKPVHLFLYRHVYLELIVKYKIRKSIAQGITFFFSAILHEFLLGIIFRIFRPIFLGFIVQQVPLIKITKWMKEHRSGLYLVWFGIIVGPSLILCSYLKIDQKVTLMFTKR